MRKTSPLSAGTDADVARSDVAGSVAPGALLAPVVPRMQWAHLRQAAEGFAEHEMATFASALAFQSFFSLFPFLIFLLALLGFFQMPQFFAWLEQQASMLVPEQALAPVMAVIAEVRQPNGGLLSIGALIALWSASGAMRASMTALNVAAQVPETRPLWKRLLVSVLSTLGLAALLVLAALLYSIGPDAAAWLAAQFGAAQELAQAWNLLRLPVWLVMLALSVTLLYWLAPARRVPLRALMPGAVLAVLAWLLLSLAFDFYVAHFANYKAVYGGIGAVIAVLFYIWLTACALLFGAEINAAVFDRRALRAVAA